MIRSELQHEGQVLALTLDAPVANILEGAMMRTITESVTAAARERPGLKLIRFEGSGDHFSYGASVPEHTRDKAVAMLADFHAMFRALADAAVPTLAVVRGRCLGGGMELASYCSFIFASPDALFGQPEIRLAVFPPVASVLLPWRLGGGAAVDACVSGRIWTALDAHRMGLVTAVDADPAQAADAFFREHIAPRSAIALRFAERAARKALTRALHEDLPEIEKMYLAELMQTHDANEGLAAFIERRAPGFQNS